MKISEIRIRKTFDENILRAIVSVTFDDCFTVHDIKIIKLTDSYLLVMPNKKSKDGRISDICHPINREFRSIMEKEIISKYEKYIEEAEKNL